MKLDEAVKNIEEALHCIQWKPSPDTPAFVAPDGQEYREVILCASSKIYDDLEDALCKMLISRIEYDMATQENLTRVLFGPDAKADLVLYWRVKPEIIESDAWGGKLAGLYTRYVIGQP